jgi:hypothetical protein
MKLLLTIWLVFSLQFLTAQTRYIDSEPIIVYPDSSVTYTSPGFDSISFYIKNYGLDTIFPTDQYYSRLQFGNVFLDPPPIGTIGQCIAPNDSVLITHVFELKYFNDISNIPVCVELQIWSSTSSKIINEKDSLKLYENNIDCTTASHSRVLGFKNNKHSNSFKIFPNPIEHGEFKIKSKHSFFRVKLTSAAGQNISNIQIEESNLYMVNVKFLPKGIYFIEIHGDNWKSTQKFIRL